MELNSLVFPAPERSYTVEDFEDELLWIPHPGRPHIPCVYLPYEEGSSKYMIYFHGNAEDLGLAFEMMDVLRVYLKVHMIGVEYPGYGIYPGRARADVILEDAAVIYEFFTNTLGISPQDIIVFGRSIGSGPATFLAQEKPLCALVLMSAYTSIKDAVRNIAGRVGKMLVKDRFRNVECIQRVFCPTFIIHGQKDKLIPYSHAQVLHQNCAGPCFLHLPEDMDHNFFEYTEDLLMPLGRFFTNCQVNMQPRGLNSCAAVPIEYFSEPSTQPKANNQGKLNKFIQKIKK